MNKIAEEIEAIIFNFPLFSSSNFLCINLRFIIKLVIKYTKNNKIKKIMIFFIIENIYYIAIT